ncbi:proteasome activator complex subunit 1 [Corythoichthys intestinalis]|uniref:proteasome activator complex subunit 1 n=1 Tax=Corythoichthys intestinalis TaxID=161448 RepID=UPI0025A4D4AD|nr:proteasome activator complex subunit 1 [Corythoichthys intestinalis]XP_061810030.1 proteasome activator complex subunit 1-like [Nerophis lumbriciformis]
MAAMDIFNESKPQMDGFSNSFTKEAEDLVSTFFPQKIEELQQLLKTAFSSDDLASLKAPLDIPIPDPVKEEAKRKKMEEEKKEQGDKKDKKEDEEESGPPCGPICCNERVETLLKEVKPQIQTLKEKINMLTLWIQLQIPKIEDGDNFGVAVQEKVFEMLTSSRTKIEGFQTQMSKYYNERGDAVAKASKTPHVGDYRELVRELDENQFVELRIMVLDICATYAALFDIISKNYSKIKRPRGDSKALIY